MLKFLRILLKVILRLITRKCEIERAAIKFDCQKMEDSITVSKRLPFTKLYVLQRLEQFDDEHLAELFRVKQINGVSRRQLIKEQFSRIANKNKAITLIDNLRQIKYDSKNKEHEEQLRELWDHLQPGKQYERFTNLWIDIGFQGNDPATDFRGVGILGLINLNYFAKNHKEQAIKCLKDSQNPRHTYFFCSAGLYISLHIFQIMRVNHISHFFYDFADPLHKFNDIFSDTFVKFNEFFIQQPNACFMQFNQIIKDFFDIEDKNLVFPKKKKQIIYDKRK